MIEIKVPALGESQNIAVIARWLKQVGDYVHAGENILELETDKVGIDVPAPVSGLLCEIVAEGAEVEVGAVIASVDETKEQPIKTGPKSVDSSPIKEVEEENKEDAVIVEPIDIEEKEAPLYEAPLKNMTHQNGIRREKMSRLRQTIARNLKNAQNTAAILTTFNEIDMGAVKELRATYKEAFEKRHNGVRLGFMSFFARAVIEALKDYPILNAQIEGEDILYYDHVNLGIAVGTDRGLVVPVLHHAEEKSFRDLEKNISDYGKRAREGALALSELTGGSFTITNGGIFGSLLSTPILNAPQSGVLGMHAIHERPVARHGEVVIRPMMYVALSYDHRLIDGSDAVRFLVRVKELIEDPRRLLLDV